MKKVHTTSVGELGGAGGLCRDKEQDIILVQHSNIIVAFVTGER